MARHSANTVVRHEGFVSGAGARIYFKTLGKGLPLLLLHGGPGADHSDFLPYLQPLARKYRLVLVDERGSGRSERLADARGYTLENMVRDLEQLRAHLRLERWVVLGHSFGGILAQAYAVRHPRRVAGLILAGTASSARAINSDFKRIRHATSKSARLQLDKQERAGIFRPDGQYTPAYAALVARVLAPYMYAKKAPARLPPPLGMEVLREMWVRRSDFRVDGNLKGFDFSRQLTRVKAPSLVVIGDRDLVSVQSADASRAALPRATLAVLAECGHMMFVDQAALFNHVLEGFLHQCAASQRRLPEMNHALQR
jgi:proline iminopeptidase